jgi:hypothetical protein
MLGAIDLESLNTAFRNEAGWGVGSWRDDADPADEVTADRQGIRVSDNLVLYPRAIEMLRAVDELDASDQWA